MHGEDKQRRTAPVRYRVHGRRAVLIAYTSPHRQPAGIPRCRRRQNTEDKATRRSLCSPRHGQLTPRRVALRPQGCTGSVRPPASHPGRVCAHVPSGTRSRCVKCERARPWLEMRRAFNYRRACIVCALPPSWESVNLARRVASSCIVFPCKRKGRWSEAGVAAPSVGKPRGWGSNIRRFEAWTCRRSSERRARRSCVCTPKACRVRGWLALHCYIDTTSVG